jgi:carotenoid cleavage dioxygenase
MNAQSKTTTTARSRFLEGPFAPVEEEITAFDLPVVGSLPRELNGRYLRNGPNPMNVEDPNYHWFMGPGMVHGVRLRNGRAEWYRNRWVRSKAIADALGEKWPAGPIHDGSDFAANTHIISHGGRTLATVEAGPLPYELTDELSTIGPCDFEGTLPLGYAAHTKLDRSTGDLHAVAYSYRRDFIQHIVVDGTGKVSRVTDVPVADRPMMHDFALTEKYVVLFDLPVTFSLDAAKAGKEMPYVWNPAHEARVGLLDRKGSSGAVRWFAVEPCFIFHSLNAYDDGANVVVDMCRYSAPYDVSALTGREPVTLDRWVIDTQAGKVTESRIDEHYQEFPRVDERVIGRKHRYGYSTAAGQVMGAVHCSSKGISEGTSANSLLKHDLTSGKLEAHSLGWGAYGGEAVFAPRSPDAAEDDGYVMAFVQDPTRGATDLVILASQDFTGTPVARVQLPARVPLGFHGSWIADL